jgi:hypothetical protein
VAAHWIDSALQEIRGGERVDEPAYGFGFGNFILVMAAGAQFEVSGLGRHRSGV